LNYNAISGNNGLKIEPYTMVTTTAVDDVIGPTGRRKAHMEQNTRVSTILL